MKYENKKTGAILDSPSPISGGDWIEYGAKPEADDVSVETKETKDEVEKDVSGMSKEDVMNELDALGVAYDKNAKKDALIDLMMGA